MGTTGLAVLASLLAGCGGSGRLSLAAAPVPPVYAEATARAPTASAAIVAAVDTRGVGANDLFLAGRGRPRLFLDVGGSFVDASGLIPPLDLRTNAVAVTDLDGDGLADVILANGPAPRTVTCGATTRGGGYDIEITDATTSPLGGQPSVMSKRPGFHSQALIAFPDVAVVPPYAQVLDARLELYQRFPTGTQAAIVLDVYQNTATFTASGPQGTTWALWYASGTAPIEPQSYGSFAVFSGGAGQYHAVTVTALAQRWVSDPIARERGCTVSRTAGPFDANLASDDYVVTPGSSDIRPPRLTITYLDASNIVLMNKGGGVFADETAAWLPPRTAIVDSRAVATGDLDGDGAPDVVFANDGSPPEVLLNRFGRRSAGGPYLEDVGGRLSPPRLAADRAVALLDVDGDGELDILFAAAHAPAALYRNGGGASALTDEAAARLPGIDAEVVGAAVGDANGDGRRDVFLATSGPTIGLLLVGDRRGRLVDASGAVAAAQATGAASALLTDLNGDGIEELLAADPGGAPVLLLGLGGGRFGDASSVLPPSATGATTAAAADFDGDGKVDLFLSGPGGVRALLLRK